VDSPASGLLIGFHEVELGVSSSMGCAGRLATAMAPLLLASLAGAADARVWQRIDQGAAPGAGWNRTLLQDPAPGSRIVTLEATPPPVTTAILRAAPAAAAPAAGLVRSDLPASASAPFSTGIEAAPGRAPGLAPLLSPFLSGGQPTGFAGRWGDYSISGSAGTAGRERDGQPDGSVNLGLSFGDPIRAVGVDLFWGIGSTKNFGANGGVGANIGRVLVSRPGFTLAAAGGVIDAYTYGNEADVENPITPYGAVTMVVPLQPGNPEFQRLLQISAGGGGRLFAPLNDDFRTRGDAGVFGAVGVELTRNLGASVGMSGRGANVSLSYIPFHDVPIFFNLLAADVFNSTPYGTIGVLTVGWGDNFRTGFFNN
jgi:hypothetical protein